MIATVLAVLLALAPTAADGGSVEAEFLVRERAARIDAAAEAIARDLASDEWRARLGAIEVLARARGGDPAATEPLVRRALDDPHPNVRARALDAAALRRVDAGPERWDALAADPLPAVRRALARTLLLVRPADAAERLAALAEDDDPLVADEAFRALLALGDAGAARAAEAWRRRGLASDPRALLEATEVLARGPRADALFLALEGEPGSAEAALLAAAAARCGSPADPRALLAGWFAPLAEDDPRALLELEQQLQDGAAAIGDALLPHLARDLAALDRWIAGDEAELRGRRPPLAARFDAGAVDARTCLAHWARAAVLAARGDGRLLDPVMRGLSDAAHAVVVEEAYGRLDALRPPIRGEPLRGLAARFPWIELAGEVHGRTGDPAAGAWLVRALDDPHGPVRREAFEQLATIDDPRPYQDVLHARWSRMDARVALNWLPRFSRRHPLDAFAPDLVDLWEAGARSVSIVELLSAFEDRPDLARELAVWLRAELERLERAANGEAGADASEGLAKALVLALARMDADEDVFAEALEVAGPISDEVAKLAAARLGRTTSGRERLLPWLAPSRPSRARIEAALALAPEGVDAAVAVLVRVYSGCDEELRVRILRALGASGSEAGWTLPARVAADRNAGAGARLVAHEVLGAARPADRAAELLLGLAAPDRDLEGRRLALRALGDTGSPRALPGLASLTEDAAVLEPLRDDWLVAGARCVDDAPPAWWLDAWGSRPRALADEVLQARFRGARQADASFTWRAELEAASALAPHADALLGAVGAWRRGDARWLRALSETWWGSDDPAAAGAARALARAAEVAFGGEGPSQELALARLETALRCVDAARVEGRHDEAALRIEDLLADRRLGRLRTRDWQRALGVERRAEGVAPIARLETLAYAERARAALARGDREAARAALDRAREARGDSERAAEECRRLAREIEAAGE